MKRIDITHEILILLDDFNLKKGESIFCKEGTTIKFIKILPDSFREPVKNKYVEIIENPFPESFETQITLFLYGISKFVTLAMFTEISCVICEFIIKFEEFSPVIKDKEYLNKFMKRLLKTIIIMMN